MTAATMPVDVQVAGTVEMGRPQWGLPESTHVMASIMLGIEQAKKNEGIFLADTDLETDEDE